MSSRSFIGFSSLTYWDHFGPKMRTATILFDEVVLHVPTPDTPASIVDQLDEREGMSKDAQLALRTIWQPIHRVLPNYTFLSLGLKPETPERIAEVAWQVTVEETKKQLAADTPGFMHEAS